jgi:hypothetical protein
MAHLITPEIWRQRAAGAQFARVAQRAPSQRLALAPRALRCGLGRAFGVLYRSVGGGLFSGWGGSAGEASRDGNLIEASLGSVVPRAALAAPCWTMGG